MRALKFSGAETNGEEVSFKNIEKSKWVKKKV